MKVYGEGEWKVRTHGISKGRTWRKLHLQVDEATGGIVVAGASENGVSDDEMVVKMVEVNEEEIEQISADGAYDRKKVYQAIEKRRDKTGGNRAAQAGKDLEARQHAR